MTNLLAILFFAFSIVATAFGNSPSTSPSSSTTTPPATPAFDDVHLEIEFLSDKKHKLKGIKKNVKMVFSRNDPSDSMSFRCGLPLEIQSKYFKSLEKMFVQHLQKDKTVMAHLKKSMGAAGKSDDAYYAITIPVYPLVSEKGPDLEGLHYTIDQVTGTFVVAEYIVNGKKVKVFSNPNKMGLLQEVIGNLPVDFSFQLKVVGDEMPKKVNVVCQPVQEGKIFFKKREILKQ